MVEDQPYNLDDFEKDYTRHKNLFGKSLAILNSEVIGTMIELGMNDSNAKRSGEMLHDYKVIDDFSDLHEGSYIRWIRIDNPLLDGGDATKSITKGGFFCGIQYQEDVDSNTTITIRNIHRNGAKFFSLDYDKVVLFQKLSTDEMMVLMVYEELDDE
jgi:hypothetical protein